MPRPGAALVGDKRAGADRRRPAQAANPFFQDGKPIAPPVKVRRSRSPHRPSGGCPAMPRRSLLLLHLFAPSVLFVPSPLRAAEEGSFDANGVKIAYSDQGKGEPVILVHGFIVNG